MPRLRIAPTQQVLQLLALDGELDADVSRALDSSYVFLRNLEHRLQYLDDQQTQELPEKAETAGHRCRARWAMPTTSPACRADPAARVRQPAIRDRVRRKAGRTQTAHWWRDEVDAGRIRRPPWPPWVIAMPPQLAEHLLQFRDGSRYRQLPETSRQRLDKLVPRFIALCAETGQSGRGAARASLGLLEAIAAALPIWPSWPNTRRCCRAWCGCSPPAPGPATT